MYRYNICTEPDEVLFWKQCKTIENSIPGIQKKDILHDVDGSITQIYEKDGFNIIVHNSLYVGAVYIDSAVELTQFFKK